MPERIILTGGPEEAASQLIAYLKSNALIDDCMTREELLDALIEKRKEHDRQAARIAELERMNEILERQISLLLKLNAGSNPPSASSGRRGRVRRGNMDTISEERPP